MNDLRTAAQQALEALDCPGKAKTADEQAAITALKAALAEPVQEPIKWTLDGDKECGYNNWLGETPFGRILITWKGWKAHPDACVDEFPGGFQAYGEPEEVKAACDAEFARRHGNAPPQRTAEPVQEPVAWRTFDGEGGWDYRDYELNEDYHKQWIERNGDRYAHWVEPLYNRVQKF